MHEGIIWIEGRLPPPEGDSVGHGGFTGGVRGVDACQDIQELAAGYDAGLLSSA